MQIIKLELFKLSKSKGFYITLAVFFVLESLILLDVIDGILSEININGESLPIMHVVQFPDVWKFFGYFSRYFNMILALMLISQITQEFQYKTLRQHLLEGMSRIQFISSKLVTVSVLSLASALLLAVLTLIAGFKNTEGGTFDMAIENAEVIPAFFMQTFAYFSFALFIAILVRRSSLGIILFLLYGWVAEPILGEYLGSSLNKYLPLKAMGHILINPIGEALGSVSGPVVNLPFVYLSILYTVIFITASITLLYKRDV